VITCHPKLLYLPTPNNKAVSKDTLIDYKKLKRISTIAKSYKNGVSNAYMYRLRDKAGFKIIEIDGVQFIDMDSIPDEIKKNLGRL
jgi:hypothetical protein